MPLIAACTGSVEKKEEKAEEERNQMIMQHLQGIWIDDNTELPMLKIKGDSIFLASQIKVKPKIYHKSSELLEIKKNYLDKKYEFVQESVLSWIQDFLHPMHKAVQAPGMKYRISRKQINYFRFGFSKPSCSGIGKR